MKSAIMSEQFKKISVRTPTNEEDKLIDEAAADDPDALPLTDAQMDQIAPLKSLHGRQRLANKKQLVTIPYSPEVLDYFKSYGADWQSRMDAVLKEYVELHSHGDGKGA